MKIYAYNNGSKSANALAAALGVKLIKHEGSKYQAKRNHVIINWGSSDAPFKSVPHDNIRVLNSRDAIAHAVNKLTAFQLMAETVSIPDFTTDPLVAQEWLREGKDVVVRHKLNGHSGEGIEIVDVAEGPGGLPFAPLYTKYIKKAAEYRVHVFGDEAFFIQKKARKLEVPNEEVNWKVRNLKGGFIYANQNVEASDAIIEQAVEAIAALGLDFGAVDIIETVGGKAYVLEVNTACGLEGTTLEKYVEQFNKFKGN